MDCGICREVYDTLEHQPYSGFCGHSICGHCLPKLEEHTCPFCQEIGAFRRMSINYSLRELVINAEEAKRELENRENLIFVTRMSGVCVECGVTDNQYYSCITCHSSKLESYDKLPRKLLVDMLICEDCVEDNHISHMIQRVVDNRLTDLQTKFEEVIRLAEDLKQNVKKPLSDVVKQLEKMHNSVGGLDKLREFSRSFNINAMNESIDAAKVLFEVFSKQSDSIQLAVQNIEETWKSEIKLWNSFKRKQRSDRRIFKNQLGEEKKKQNI